MWYLPITQEDYVDVSEAMISTSGGNMGDNQ